METITPLPITEEELATQVEDLLRLFGWLWCHSRPARTEHGWRTPLSGDKGFLDYIALRPPRLLIFELKSEKGKLTLEQKLWFETLKECQIITTTAPLKVKGGKGVVDLSKRLPVFIVPEVYLWRPSDLDEEIVRILRR